MNQQTVGLKKRLRKVINRIGELESKSNLSDSEKFELEILIKDKEDILTILIDYEHELRGICEKK